MPHHPPVSLVLQWRERRGGGACLIASSSSNDKERVSQPRSDACIIVVVAKCSWLIIPPSFANGAAADLHINGGERRVWCQGVWVKRVAKLGEHRGHHPYNKQNPTLPSWSLQNPHHYHDTPRCVSLINRRNRMVDRLLFRRWVGGWWADIAKSSLSNQWVAPGLVQL